MEFFYRLKKTARLVCCFALGALAFVACSAPSIEELLERVDAEAAQNLPPSFGDLVIGTLQLQENTPPGTPVADLVVRASDPERKPVSIAIVERNSGAESADFELDQDAKIAVRAGASLDFEARQQYLLSVVADDAELQTKLDFEIVLLDVNETLSWSAGSPSGLVVVENAAARTPIGRPITADFWNPIDYSLFNRDGSASSEFFVDTSGRIRVKEGAALDHEGRPGYELVIRATAGEQAVEREIEVEVANEDEQLAWRVELPSSIAVAENAEEGTLVGEAFVAFDPESPIAYLLVRDDRAPSAEFFVDAHGQVKVKANANLDHEAGLTYGLIVVATSGKNSIEHAFLVEVFDVNEPPSWLGGPPTSLLAMEDAEVGALVGEPFVAEDPEDKVAYAVARRDFSRSEFFSVDAGGQLRVAAPLDFESERRHELLIIASVSGATLNKKIVVEVFDVNEAPSWSGEVPSSLVVPENSEGGVLVGVVRATDPERKPMHYDLTNRDGSVSSVFAFEGGEVRVLEGAELNFEGGQATYNVVLGVFDGYHSIQHGLEIVVGDEPEVAPAFERSQYRFYAYDRGPETNLGTTVALLGDAVVRATRPTTLSLVGSAPENLHGNFEIDRLGRLVRLSNSSLDAASNDEVVLSVRAEDGGLSAVQSVTIVLAIDSRSISDRTDDLMIAINRVYHPGGSLSQAEPTSPIPVIFGRDRMWASYVELSPAGRFLAVRVGRSETTLTLPTGDVVGAEYGEFASVWERSQSLKSLELSEEYEFNHGPQSYLFRSNATLEFDEDGRLSRGHLKPGQRVDLGRNTVEFDHESFAYFNASFSLIEGTLVASQALRVGAETIALSGEVRFDGDGNVIEAQLDQNTIIDGRVYAGGTVLRFRSDGELDGTGADDQWTGGSR